MMRPTSTLGVREDSHLISKAKQKIRIVHIFAPEIIKTDAANFRELVQRLTGRPAKRVGMKKMKKVEDQYASGGYLNELGDMDGFFFQGFSDFSMFPLMTTTTTTTSSSSSSHLYMEMIGDA